MYRAILAPLDGSPNAEAILPHALALGQAMQAEYQLLRVVEPVMVARRLPADPVVRELDDQLIDQLAALAILDAAQQDGIDLIAMATHRRRGLARVLLGSVADKVLRGVTAPVLLYRPPTHDLIAGTGLVDALVERTPKGG